MTRLTAVLIGITLGALIGMAVTNAFARAAYDVANPQEIG